MTDKEIKKALECCTPSYTKKCIECVYEQYKSTVLGKPLCSEYMRKDVLNYINRLEAENERLRDLLKRHQRHTNRIRLLTAETAKKIKAEARKEFAEELLETSVWLPLTVITDKFVTAAQIKTLLKEKTGEDYEPLPKKKGREG